MSKHKSSYESSAPVSKILPASNIYRVGDYVYVETQPSHPYQIRRIEELTKTANGQVEAKVSCFYRRRDLSNALVSQADKHAITAEEDGEIYIGEEQTEEKLHQLKHREVFLSRQLEIINANTIRWKMWLINQSIREDSQIGLLHSPNKATGKCSVTLYSEIEKLYDYLEKEDWFYYLLVYDPQQKTLLADRGEIGVGEEYQAVLEDHSVEYDEKKDRPCPETLIWNPENKLADKQCDQFLVLARSIGTFARALDCGSAVKEPSLHLSAAAASRDITLFHALDTLHQNEYDIAKSLSSMIPEEGPVLCRDEMEEWSPGEASLFEDAIKKFGKEFNDIQQEFLPWKKISNLVEYYYMWKTTDKYVQQKRMKAAEGDSKVTQIFIPSSNTAVNLTLAVQASTQYQVNVSGNLVSPNYICESCFEKESSLWYPWGPSTSQCKLFLCKDCWLYWKKFGGLKKTAKSSAQSSVAETVYKCRICSKKFNRAERLSNHMIAHKGLKCTVAGCDKSFTLKAHLSRHIAMQHSSFPEAKKLKVKTPFYMSSSPATRVTRHLCTKISRWQHFARIPSDSLNFVELKAECINSLTSEVAKKILNSKRSRKRKPLDDVVQIMKKIQKEADRINVQKPHIISNLQHTKDTTTNQPGMRKLMSPVKSSAASFSTGQAGGSNLKPGSLRSQIGNQHHSTSYKRPLDVTLDHNGVDESAPMSKRHNPVTSPLGRTGLDCHICGKIFHNQASLNHHMQMHDKGVISASQQPGSQYSDSKSAYPEPGSAASTGGIIQNSGRQQNSKTNAVTNGNQAPRPAQKVHSTQRTGRNFSSSVPQKRQINKNIGDFTGKEGDPHYVDPPQEFYFKSTKEAKKSRRSLPTRVQRKIARKPFIQIKCSQELRDSILCKKAQRKVGNMETPIVIDD